MMPGQGKPLPPALECDGEWIIEGYMFLYHADQGKPSARFTMQAHRHDGALCIGFDSAQLAATLGVDIPTLIEANQNHTLISLGVADVTPTRGGVSAKEYGFQIGDKRGSLTNEIYQQEGIA